MLFKDIIGHESLKGRLVNSVTNNRVSHAQLFLGDEGSGKLALALAYAQFLICTDKQNNDACGVCKPCQKMSKLEHPDLHFFFPSPNIEKKKTSKDYIAEWREFVLKNNLYVSLPDWYSFIQIENKQGIINADDCVDIIRTIKLKPYESDYRIIIIYMAEKIYSAAAPKLLKAFEEPPEKTLFILLAESHDAILKTILSRVQLLKIAKHSDSDVAQYLQKYHQVESQDAAIISKISGGDIVEAVRLYENADETRFYFENFAKWMRLCYKRDMGALVEWIDEMSKKTIGREKRKKFFVYALRIARNSLLLNMQAADLLAVSESEMTFLKKFHPFINERNIITINKEFNKALYQIERNLNAKIVFMDLSFQLMRLLRE